MPKVLARSSVEQEFADLIDGFEALTTHQGELDELSGLLIDFERIAGRQGLRRFNDVSREEAEAFFDEFSEMWRAYLEENARGAPLVNIWTIADLGTYEVRNCRVLKWLLDPSESHCQGMRFLNCFLQAIGEPPVTDHGSRIEVRREETTSEGDSRLDITIESSSILVWIEAKIQAEEDPKQLQRYFERAHERLRGRRFIGKLLSENGTSGEAVVVGFTRLLWSDVAGVLRRFGTTDGSGDPCAARDSFVARLAAQYADFIDSHFKRKG